MIDRENTLRWLLLGVLAVTIVFNGIGLALNATFSAEAASITATQSLVASAASPS